MEFHYYYIVQDIVGVLMAFIGIRMLTLITKMALAGQKNKNTILIFIKYALVTLAGVNFLISQFGIKPWIISIILILLSVVITPKVSAEC